MSEHHHDHDKDCHCHDCESEREGAEKTSIEEAGGVAVGLTGHIHGYNADVEARMDKVLRKTGEWVEKESGALLGHIKAALYNEEGHGITLNLTNMETGVEHHGTMEPQEKVDFNFMSAVLDVDAHELEHVMMDAIEDSGIDYHLNSGHHHHDHDHDHEHHHEHNHSHHDDNTEEVCHCKACEDQRKEETESAEKGSFWSRIKRRK